MSQIKRIFTKPTFKFSKNSSHINQMQVYSILISFPYLWTDYITGLGVEGNIIYPVWHIHEIYTVDL